MSLAVSSVGIFTGACGNNSSATSTQGLQNNSTVQLNGNTDLSSCITANGGACVYGITLTGSPGIYDYVINVDAQGPSGFGSGSMYLYFTDETGDRYSLSIYSSTRSTHLKGLQGGLKWLQGKEFRFCGKRRKGLALSTRPV